MLSARFLRVQITNPRPWQSFPGKSMSKRRIEANIAIAAFSRSVEMADGDQSLQIDALLSRATLYNLLKKPFEAVADAEAAEKLGRR